MTPLAVNRSARGQATHDRRNDAGGRSRRDRAATGGACRRGAALRRGAHQDGARVGPRRPRGVATSSRPARRWIPATLQESLAARLDRLGPAKEVAQLGAIIGREFSSRCSARSLRGADGARRGLDRLIDAGLLYGGHSHVRYTFKHALIRDAAYDSLLRARRQAIHARVAAVLAAGPARSEHPAEVVAWHYEQAGASDSALTWYEAALASATTSSAYPEAVTHGRHGLEMLARLPEGTARDERELALHVALGPNLIALHGYGAQEVEDTYERAHALCGERGDAGELVETLWGLPTTTRHARSSTRRRSWVSVWSRSRARATTCGPRCGRISSSAPRLLARRVPRRARPPRWRRRRIRSDRLVVPARRTRSMGGGAGLPRSRAVDDRASRQRASGVPGRGGARSPGNPSLQPRPRPLLPGCAAPAPPRGRCGRGLRRRGHRARTRARIPQLARLGRGPVRLAHALAGRGEQALECHAGRMPRCGTAEPCWARQPCCCSSPRSQCALSRADEAMASVQAGLALAADTKQHAWEGELRRLDGELALAAGRDGDAAQALASPSPTRTRPTRSPMSCALPRRWCGSNDAPQAAARQRNVSPACWRA